jgi:hypothetical protein
MKKFKIECSWTEYHSGELIVEAEEPKEAIELLKMEQNRLLEILIDKYANETFSCLSDISVVNRGRIGVEESDVLIKESKILVEND